jgi:hypothetical protein
MARTKKTPAVTEEAKKLPDVNTEEKTAPEVSETAVAAPEAGVAAKEVPNVTPITKKPPMREKPENTVLIGDTLVEIKPTLMRYQRDRTAAFYRIMELYPLIDILGMDASNFGDGRDGDKCVFDWLIAVTNDPDLIKENYDKLDTETIEKMLAIFRRVNKIDEKETKLKNVAAPGAKKG